MKQNILAPSGVVHELQHQMASVGKKHGSRHPFVVSTTNSAGTGVEGKEVGHNTLPAEPIVSRRIRW